MNQPDDTQQRRASDHDPNRPLRPVRTDVFAKVEEITGISLSEVTVQSAHARAALSELLDRLEQAEKARDTDALTGVFNRGVFDREMQREIDLRKDTSGGKRQAYEHPPLTVVMFDINDFKAVNTEHTHAGGDEAIKHVGRVLAKTIEEKGAEHMAELLGKSLRKTDVVTRLGGDEFAIIMYDTKESAELKTRLDAIRQKIIDTPCIFKKGDEVTTIKLDVSYGCHELAPNDTIPSIIADFSEKMKAHKKVTKGGAGGNKNVAASPHSM